MVGDESSKGPPEPRPARTVEDNTVEMVARPDLPLRDLLRFLIPGAIGAGYVEFAYKWATGQRLTQGNAELVFLILIIGLACFASLIHRRLPPWKGWWEAEVQKIRDALTSLTGDNRYKDELNAKPLYKVWLDSDGGTPQLRSHLHYSTGLYYTWAAAAFLSALFSVAALILTTLSVLSACDVISLDFNGPAWSMALAAGGGLFLTWAFGASGKSALQDAVREGVVALHLPESQVILRALATAAATTEGSTGATP